METPQNPLDEVFEVRQVKIENKEVSRIRLLAKIGNAINYTTQYLVKSLFVLVLALWYLYPNPATRFMGLAFIFVVGMEIFNYSLRQYIVKRVSKVTTEAIKKTIETVENREPTVIEKMLSDELRKDKTKQEASEPWKN